MSTFEEANPTLRKHLIRESTKSMKENPKGIIETLKDATSDHQLVMLADTLNGYAYASPKTIRKFRKIEKRTI